MDDEGVRTVTFGDAEFEIDNNDFNVLSFRSNAVLRWEWRRGSTLYLVWQQNRSDEEEEGSLVGGRDLWSSLRSEGENFFAIKITYWLPLS